MIENFEQAWEVMRDVVGVAGAHCGTGAHCAPLREDERFYADSLEILEGGEIVPMAACVGEIVARYLDAIKIHNALTTAINAMHINLEHIRKPLHLKITDDQSIKLDLEDLTKIIPLLAVIKAAKDMGDEEVGRIVDWLLERL